LSGSGAKAGGYFLLQKITPQAAWFSDADKYTATLVRRCGVLHLISERSQVRVLSPTSVGVAQSVER